MCQPPESCIDRRKHIRMNTENAIIAIDYVHRISCDICINVHMAPSGTLPGRPDPTSVTTQINSPIGLYPIETQ